MTEVVFMSSLLLFSSSIKAWILGLDCSEMQEEVLYGCLFVLHIKHQLGRRIPMNFS